MLGELREDGRRHVVDDGLLGRAQRWGEAHPAAAERLRALATAASWVSLVVVAVALALVPGLRAAMGPIVGTYVAVLVTFWAARTKTVSWRLVAATWAGGGPPGFDGGSDLEKMESPVTNEQVSPAAA